MLLPSRRTSLPARNELIDQAAAADDDIASPSVAAIFYRYLHYLRSYSSLHSSAPTAHYVIRSKTDQSREELVLASQLYLTQSKIRRTNTKSRV